MKPLWFAIALILHLSCANDQPRQNRVSATFHAEELPEDHKVDLSQRKVFPFSVVPGGTINREEVRRRVAADPVVRSHYQGLQIDKLKPFRLTQPAQGYISYRIGNRVFWTSKRMYLKSGEILLSDGVHMIRGRCGNRISVEAQAPVAPYSEATQAAFDLPSYDVPILNAIESGLPFMLPGNGRQSFDPMAADLPAPVFEVAPGGTGPGRIGGALPGGIASAGKDGEILLQSGYSWLFPQQPALLDRPSLAENPFTPIQSVNNLPTYSIGLFPIGVGGAVFYVFEPTLILQPPVVMAATFPPYYNLGTFPIANGSPPYVVSLPPAVVPPGETVHPSAPGEHPPSAPIHPITPITPVPPVPPTSKPPETDPPPVFESIPEPATAWMVGLAAVVFALVRARLLQQPALCRNSGGQPPR